MTHTRINQQGEMNQLLKSLPKSTYIRLSKHFEPCPLQLKDILYRPKVPIQHVYFPQNCILSLIIPMKNGTQVEAATVGNEGMGGVGVFLDSLLPHMITLCQVPGTATRIKAAPFKKEIDRDPKLHKIMHHYTQSLMTQFAQGVACNRLHTVKQRAARWLLLTRDRVQSDNFGLTQEFLGTMLGVRRASVTEVARQLQKQNLITYTRGAIQILNRKALEKVACECYQVIKTESNRLTKK
jgi:hypothetical protein